MPPHLNGAFSALSDGQRRLLLDRALVAPVDVSLHPQSFEDSFEWTVRPDGGVVPHGTTVYLDGSMLDGPDRLVGRTGWGFCALDERGQVVAAAFGVPPWWVQDIHGAELWALYVAMSVTMLGARYRSDRLAVVQTFQAGHREATAASVELARLWSMVFAACDDYDRPEVQVDLAWMPSHTSPADVGRAYLSNGELLTECDRSGNERADLLAKRGAKLHRLPTQIKRAIDGRVQLATWAAHSLGIATHVANNAIIAGASGTRRDAASVHIVRRREAAHGDALAGEASGGRVTGRPRADTTAVGASGAAARADDSDSYSSCGPCEAIAPGVRKKRKRKRGRDRTRSQPALPVHPRPALSYSEVAARVCMLADGAALGTAAASSASPSLDLATHSPACSLAAPPVLTCRVAPRVGRPGRRASSADAPRQRDVAAAIARLVGRL